MISIQSNVFPMITPRMSASLHQPFSIKTHTNVKPTMPFFRGGALNPNAKSDNFTATLVSLLAQPDKLKEEFGLTGYEFASDIFALPDPLALKLIKLVNGMNAGTYQNGTFTQRGREVFQHYFGKKTNDVAVWFTHSGTGANRISTAPFLSNIDMLVATDVSHAYGREAGAVHILNNGAAVRTIPHVNGKLTAPLLEAYIQEQFALPSTNNRFRMVTISQPTEFGTVYTVDEVKKLAEIAHKHKMLFQVDGARLFYAAAALGKSLKAITTDLNVDLVTVGGSKNLLREAEAAVFLPHAFSMRLSEINSPTDIYRNTRINLKQSGQLAGHTEPIAAQLTLALENDRGLNFAKKANDQAQKLKAIFESDFLKKLGVYIYYPVDTNVVMVSMPKAMKQYLNKRYNDLKAMEPTDPTQPNNTVVRFMTSARTTQAEIRALKIYIEKWGE